MKAQYFGEKQSGMAVSSQMQNSSRKTRYQTLETFLLLHYIWGQIRKNACKYLRTVSHLSRRWQGELKEKYWSLA